MSVMSVLLVPTAFLALSISVRRVLSLRWEMRPAPVSRRQCVRLWWVPVSAVPLPVSRFRVRVNVIPNRSGLTLVSKLFVPIRRFLRKRNVTSRLLMWSCIAMAPVVATALSLARQCGIVRLMVAVVRIGVNGLECTLC